MLYARKLLPRNFEARRTFVTKCSLLQTACHTQPTSEIECRRTFKTSTRRGNVGQQASNPYSYIQSGVSRGDEKNLVEVKKVLVIGSGGLSIGQAGEFDYSGMIKQFS